MTREDLFRIARKQAEMHSAAKKAPLADLLKDWTDQEVRMLLEESLRDPKMLEGSGYSHLIFAEYLRRDFSAGLAWFNGQSALHQSAFATALSNAWPPERIAEGITFLLNNPEVFRRASPSSLIQRGVEAASGGGADAVLSLIHQLREKDIDLNYDSRIAFAAGFDFAGLMGSDEMTAMNSEFFKTAIIRSWRERDRDGAFQWASENGEHIALISFYEDAGKDSRQWLAGKLETMPAEKRSEFFDLLTPRWLMFPADARTLLQSTQDPGLRGEIRNRAAQGIFSGRVHDAIAIVDDLPDDEARIRFIEALEPTTAAKGRIRGTPLDAGNEEHLRGKLLGWSADPKRVDVIISRIRKP